MKKHVFLLLTAFTILFSISASAQMGLLNRLQKMKDKVNVLDAKYRVTWLPFTEDKFHMKTVTCAYGTTDLYKFDFTYNDNNLLEHVTMSTISPTSGEVTFFCNYIDLAYNYSDSVVFRRQYAGRQGNDPIYIYGAFKMRKGRIVASQTSNTYFKEPYTFTNHFYYNEAGKCIAPRSQTYTYDANSRLTATASDFNGVVERTAYTYDEKNPLLYSVKQEKKEADGTWVPYGTNFSITKNDKKEEVVTREAHGNFAAKPVVILSRDYFGRVTRVSNPDNEKLLNSTIEYEEGASNDKLFFFFQNANTFIQMGNVASGYYVPFFLFY